MKTIMITWAADEIGKHLAKKLVSEGHSVILHGRNPQKLVKAIKKIKDENAFAYVYSYLAYFSNHNDVYHLAEGIKKTLQKLMS